LYGRGLRTPLLQLVEFAAGSVKLHCLAKMNCLFSVAELPMVYELLVMVYYSTTAVLLVNYCWKFIF
jgi:hypothetical protein